MFRNFKQILLIVVAFVATLFLYDYLKGRNDSQDRLEAQSALIEKQLRNVSKLIVTEANYAKIYNYENKETYGLDIFTSKKTALIISNARAQVAYNLRDLQYDIDVNTKTITINYIPKPELTIDPNLQFYRIENGYFNTFQAADLNKVKEKITKDLREKIMNSEVLKNAENRLLSELSQIFVLTSSLEWVLVYKGNTVDSTQDMSDLLP